jgi:CelD/BcsL family acetyltransferase involved in cellulose biosynthesis
MEEIGAEWKAFARTADYTVFQSFEWLANWHRHIGTARRSLPAIVVVCDADEEILCILPFAVETHATVRRLRWLGSQLCDYNGPLLGPQFSARVSAERFRMMWREALALLKADPRLKFDVIDLVKMPKAIGEQRNPFLDLHVGTHPSGAYVANLAGSWDELYAAKRSAATRKRERRQLRQLADHGNIAFVEVTEAEEARRTLATLMEQKSGAFARMGVEDSFRRPGYRDFFLAVASDPAMRELVHVSRLDVGAQIAAASVGLRLRNCYYLILSSSPPS